MEIILDIAPYLYWIVAILFVVLMLIVVAYERGRRAGFEEGLDAAEEAFEKFNPYHERL